MELNQTMSEVIKLQSLLTQPSMVNFFDALEMRTIQDDEESEQESVGPESVLYKAVNYICGPTKGEISSELKLLLKKIHDGKGNG